MPLINGQEVGPIGYGLMGTLHKHAEPSAKRAMLTILLTRPDVACKPLLGGASLCGY